MRLWDWAVAAYAAPDVAEACLLLQDRHEQNVPLLLWSAWVAATGRRPDEETLEAACDTARAWDSLAVAPLRAIRRTLKAPIPDIDDAPREAIRDRIKAVELEAERRLLEALEALAPEPAGPPRAAGARARRAAGADRAYDARAEQAGHARGAACRRRGAAGAAAAQRAARSFAPKLDPAHLNPPRSSPPALAKDKDKDEIGWLLPDIQTPALIRYVCE